ncbi:hypothetical protein ACFFK0_07155 [Paenibacillus chartarius]|uniref:GNAT family N-acetyltransferase n=1 Tax=Paenibacillus chartarius TaxID=747481 RepID=A0ABV6DI14_9BACL
MKFSQSEYPINGDDIEISRATADDLNAILELWLEAAIGWKLKEFANGDPIPLL